MKRYEIEIAIVTQLLYVMEQRGWKVVAVDDGGDEDVEVKNIAEALDAVLSVEESLVRFLKDDRLHSVHIILGNGHECLVDHSCSHKDDFEQLMDTHVYPFCEQFTELGHATL